MQRSSCFFSAVLLVLISFPLFAQSSDFNKPAARVTEAVDNSKLTALKNQVHPLVRKAVDQGPVEDALQLDRLTLMLKRSDAQQQALTTLLADQQNPSSPNYHQWLTAKEFGERFGPADSDIEQVTAWLQSQGFTVNQVANGRGYIEFSGSAAQVSSAFHTSIHHYSVNGEPHIGNSTTLAIPAALAPVVESVHSLNDFRSRPLHTKVAAQATGTKGDPSSRPSITFDTHNQVHGLAPSDYAAIYNIQTLYNQGVTGTGKTIAVVGRSNIKPATLANFRSIFGLGTGNNSTVLNGPDPGVLDQVGVPCTNQPDCAERDEALLDNEWSSAIAPGAAVKFVVSKSTSTADGVDLSEMYIIDNNLADVMTESFGSCEALFTQTDANAVSALASQAAAEGITYLVSTGDNGAAGCADPTTASATGTQATPSVNILASSPFTLAIGGTQFNEGCTIGSDGVTQNCTKYAQYWNSSNAPSNSATPFLSALSYIPENVWNEACPTATTGSVTGCGASKANLFASSGGASQFFTKSSWQQLAIAGIPAANHRYLPDVSLTAAGHDFYVVCLQDADCVPDSTGSFPISGIAGTSASAPAFAGIMALVNQKVGARQGDAHTTIYTLAAKENFAQCNGSSQTGAPAANCIFNDTKVGNNAVPGQTGYGTTSASYQAGVGFDQATGLGSVNVANLVNNWTSAAGTTATTVTLTVTPSTSVQGTSVVLTATLAGTGGTPTGVVTFVNSNNITLGTATAVAGSATVTTTALPAGTYTVVANYAGDTTFSASTSNAVSVTVNTRVATTTTVTPTPTSAMVGQPITFNVAVTHSTGAAVPTGTVTLSIDGVAGTPTALDAAASASIALSTLTVGTHSVAATYSGDATYASSTSSAVSVTVNAAVAGTYTMSTSPSTITLGSAGATTGNTTTLTVSPVNGFTGTVSLTCAISAVTPAAALPPTCSVPASVSISGAAATATVSINSIAATAKPVVVGRRASPGWLAAGGIAFAGVFFFGFPRRRNWGLMLALLLFVAVAGGIGCGSGNPPVMHTPATTAGTYTAVVTGTSGTLSVSTNVTVVVP
jgi:subtilase family serine protease